MRPQRRTCPGCNTTPAQRWSFAALGLFVVSACASPPADAVRRAHDALLDAHRAGAQEYAPSELRAAEASVAKLSEEETIQARRFALFQSYDRTALLAATAIENSRKAMIAAEASKEATHRRVQFALHATRTSLSRSSAALRALSGRADERRELATAAAELVETARALDEATLLFDSRRYRDAELVIAPAQAAALAVERTLSKVESSVAAP